MLHAGFEDFYRCDTAQMSAIVDIYQDINSDWILSLFLYSPYGDNIAFSENLGATQPDCGTILSSPSFLYQLDGGAWGIRCDFSSATPTVST